MATGLFFGQHAGPGKVVVALRFLGDGLNDPSEVVGDGVTSVVRSGLGLYTVTLASPYTRLETFQGSYQDITYSGIPTRAVVGLVTEDVAATGSLVVSVDDTTGPVDLTSTQWAHVTLVLRNTAVGT